MFKLPSNVYDVLKYCVCVLFPALSTFYTGIASVLNLPYADEVAKITALVCTLIGTLIHISSKNYWESVNKDESPEV